MPSGDVVERGGHVDLRVSEQRGERSGCESGSESQYPRAQAGPVARAGRPPQVVFHLRKILLFL